MFTRLIRATFVHPWAAICLGQIRGASIRVVVLAGSLFGVTIFYHGY